MKRSACSAVLIALSLPEFFAQEPANPVPLHSSVAAVTVYADRARVTRRTAVALKAGAQVLEFRRLPGWIDEDSVRLALQPAEAGRIVDVQVSREFLAQADDKDVLKAEAAVREVAEQLAAIDDDLRVLAQQAKQIEEVKIFSMDKLPRDMATREIGIEAYGRVVDFVAEALRRNGAARRELEKKRRELAPEQEARARKLAELQSLVQLQQTLVRVTLDCPTARQAELSLTYLLPGATWEPVHELRARGKTPNRVDLASFAVVTQTTGEDWTGAELAFSTQSSEATIKIPELTSLLLNDRTVPQSGQSGFLQALDNYRGQNKLWYAYNNPKANMNDFEGNWSKQQNAQAKTTAVFQRLQTRGTTAHFPGRTRPPVRGDGRSVRVPIGEASLPAVLQIVAAPEVSLNAANVLQLTNTCAQALLPGRIAVYHDGAFLGMTDMDFVASAESFPVFLGVADQIKLSRMMNRRRSSLVRGRKTRMQVCFDGLVENLSSAPVKIALTDRIPVSENKEIRVFGIDTEPEVDPDSTGIVKWAVSLKPGQKFPYRVEYTIEYPPEELQKMRQSKGEPSATPAAKVDLDVQIRSLESKF